MSVSILVTDPKFYCSPYGTYSDGSASRLPTSVRSDATYVLWPDVGNGFTIRFSGTSCVMSVDVSSLVSAGESAGNYPIIAYKVDSDSWTRRQLTSSDTFVTLATGRTAGIHSLTMEVVALWWTSDCWNTPVQAVKCPNPVLTLDAGASLYQPVLLPGFAVFFGDSVTAAEEILGAGVSNSHQDSTGTFAHAVATSLRCRAGIIGKSGQGFNNVGGGNVPIFGSALDKFYSGKSRLVAGQLDPVPNVAVVCHGINDGVNNVESQMVSDFAAMRAMIGSTTPIVVLVPWTADQAAHLANAVVTLGDAHTFLVNTGTSSYANAGDKHMLTAGHAQFAIDQLPLYPTVSVPPSVVSSFSSVFGSVVR